MVVSRMKKNLKNISINESTVDDVEFDYSDDDDDEDLIRMVEERIKNHEKYNKKTYTWEEFKKMHGITDEDLEDWEDVEIE